MWLQFNGLAGCTNCSNEIKERLGLTGNVTSAYAQTRETVDGKYVIPKPKAKVINEIKLLVRPIQIETENEQGESVLIDSIEVVKKQFDELGNDITQYDSTEYEIIKQVDLTTLFNYTEVDTVEFPAEEV